MVDVPLVGLGVRTGGGGEDLGGFKGEVTDKDGVELNGGGGVAFFGVCKPGHVVPCFVEEALGVVKRGERQKERFGGGVL